MISELSYYEQVFYYYYSILHIPITIAIDSSVAVPAKYHPASKLVEWHIRQNNDFLLYEKPVWLYWFVVIELVVQLPLFFYFVQQFRKIWKKTDAELKIEKVKSHNAKASLYKWLKIYGFNASFTTLICILVILQRGYYPYSGDVEEPLSRADKLSLVYVYLPTFLIPLRLCFL